MVRPAAAPYFVRWVRRFLSRPASDEPLTDQVRGFCEELKRNGGSPYRQVRQADQALRIYFVNFLKRGERLPVVLSMPETIALLSAMSGTPRLMATLIYGGGLRVTECCELRIKDLDFDQGLVVVRRGKGDKDRSTLLAEVGREELRTHLRKSEALHQVDRKYTHVVKELRTPARSPIDAMSTERAGCISRGSLGADPRVVLERCGR